MSESTDKIVATLIQKAMNGVDQAVDFSKTQLPDVVEQLMQWKLVSYFLLVAVCLAVIIGSIFLFKKAVKLSQEDEGEFLGVMGLILAVVCATTSLVLLIGSIGNLLQLWLAPKVWLIEYAAQLVSGN